MLRVLMVLEDYSELMYLQSLLKKLGFDVEAIQNPKSFHDGILNINPDLLVLTGNGRKVHGLELVGKLRRPRTQKVILMGAGEPGPDVDAWVDSPIIPTVFLEAMARICKLDSASLADKFFKLQEKEAAENKRELKLNPFDDADMDKATVAGGNFGSLKASSLSSEARSDRYKKFLTQSPEPTSHGLTSKQVALQVRELRKNETENADLERERKEFVKHLFDKKKKA